MGRHGNQQNLRGQAAVGVMECLLQPCRVTDAQTAPEKGSALRLKARLPGISPMIWRRVLVPETMPLHELHGVLQTRICVLDGTLRIRFQSWYPGSYNAANSNQAIERTAA